MGSLGRIVGTLGYGIRSGIWMKRILGSDILGGIRDKFWHGTSSVVGSVMRIV